MKTLTLGAGAVTLSRVGFGGMPLSTAGRPDPATAIRVIHAALDSGATLLDTADVYCLDNDDLGHNERLIARALEEWTGPRHTIFVGTKGGMDRPEGRWERRGDPDHLHAACRRSLQALGTDCIDLYQLHAPDPAVPFAESVGALRELRDAGLVRWVGLSNVTTARIREAQNIVPILTVQNRLNPFFREALSEGVVEYCAEQGLGFLAYSPVGGGRLNRKLPNHATVQAIAEDRDATPHQVALAWVRAQGPTVVPIPGSRTPDHARSAIASAALELAPEELAAITDASFSRD